MNDPFQIHQSFIVQHTRLLLASYRHWLKRDLIPTGENVVQNAEDLFRASIVVVSAGTDPDQILNYGNETALQLWKMDWDVLCRTPSRQTAEPVHQETRAAFLNEVRTHGFIENYEGIRISSEGKRFRIQEATVWNLLNGQGRHVGQAATFSKWLYCE
jgi:hypothetical protein